MGGDVTEHYLSANSFYRRKFGGKVYKLSLDGGFSCPNRDGTVGDRGCIFCSGRGSGDFSYSVCGGMDEAVEKAKALISSKVADAMYIAYFQSFTNTYAPLPYLKKLYGSVIARDDIAALDIATRPDCLGEDVVSLLGELNRIKPVFVELGLQTIHPQTAEYIRRGYELSVFDDAVFRLKAAGINVIVHMILGLPGESEDMIYETAEYISRSGADGIKLQLLHVLEGTDLAADYRAGKLEALSLERYSELLAGCIMRLKSDMVVHRLTGDGAKKDLIAPLWSGDKKRVLNYINRYFDSIELVQGSLYL